MKLITPGANGIDPWWDGEATQEQAKVHLREFDIIFPDKDALDIYMTTAVDITAWQRMH